MRKRVLRLRDADRKLRRLGIRLEHLELLERLRLEIDAVAAVHLLHLLLDAVLQGLAQVAEEREVVRLVAGPDDGLCEFERAFAALEPVVGHRERRARLLRHRPHEVAFLLRVGVERIEADDRLDARAADDVDVREEVVATLLQELEVLRRVHGVEREARLHRRRAAVRLEGADRRDEDDAVGLVARAAALDVPELLEAHVRGEAALRDDIVAKRAREPVRDHGVLPDCDVGERSRVNEHRLSLDGLHQRRLDRVHEKRAHRAVDLEVLRRHRRAAL